MKQRMAKAPDIRFSVDPGDVPAEKAARRLHLTEAQFRSCLPRLLARGFPMPDPDTGMFDLEAIDQWRKRRHPALFPEHAVAGVRSVDLGERFRLAQQDRHALRPRTDRRSAQVRTQ